ncbi:MAG: peptidase MA family metallohydrolase [Chloroflexota bacterium]|nr:peptidase MA family metallohydrolase [Chloroflexota bacterium]
MKRVGLLLATAGIIAAAWTFMASVSPLSAQSAEEGPTVQGTRFENAWPDSVTVTSLVGGAEDVESATFLYAVLPEGALTREPAEVASGDVTRVTAVFPTRDPMLWIPAGADFEWHWEFVFADGEKFETVPQIWRYEDPRFEWQSLKEGPLEVAWYDDRGVAQTMLDEGIDALEEISPFLGLEELIPIKVYVWANTEDARQVERIQSERFEESVITGGTRVLADLVHIYTPSRWVIRHELTHVLTKLAGEGPYGDLPAWLDEGMATLAEGDWLERRGGALQYAINNDIVLSLRSMESPSNRPGFVDIFYGQSAAVVLYLLTEYGNERMNDLFRAFKEGSSVDDALLEVYGLDRDGLDNAWRDSVGLGPREQEEDRSTTIEDEVISGPEVAGEDQSEQAGEAEPERAEESEPEATGEEQQESQQEGAQAIEAGEDEQAESETATSRSEDEIADRVAEIERRQDERRPRPVFEVAGPFPWEWPLIGIAGGLVILSGLLLVRVLTARN